MAISRRTFKNWPELRYDILFNKMTIAAAAEKWKVSKEAISQHLKKHPRLYDAYYSRPWAEKQMKLAFLPAACTLTQEMIDDYYETGGENLVILSSPEYKQALLHKSTCGRCKIYEKLAIKKSHTVFRVDCPPIYKLIHYDIDPAHSKGTNDVAVTEHMLYCHFCRTEYHYLSKIPLVEIKKLGKFEYDYYPVEGNWRDNLAQNEIEKIINIIKTNSGQLELLPDITQTVQTFLVWWSFRRDVIKMI